MQTLKQSFEDSMKELQNRRTFVCLALFLAIAVVLGFYFSIQITDFIKIGLSFLPNQLASMFFGPVAGALVGGLADILKYLVKPVGAFFPGFTLSAILAGCIYGVALYKKPLSFRRILAIKVIVAVVVNSLLNTVWLTILYGQAFAAILPLRVVKQLVVVPIEAVMLYLVAKTLLKANIMSVLRAKAK